MIKISVIVPVYNVCAYLDKCVESIVSQKMDEMEILLIDDGSTDNSGELCDAWAEKDSRIKVYHKTNGGLSDARNYGMDRAVGEYIAFVDSDDYLEPNTLGKLYACAKENDLDVLRTNFCKTSSKGTIGHYPERDILLGETMEGMEFFFRAINCGVYKTMVWAGLYRRTFLIDNQLYFKPGIYHEDELWFPLVLKKATRVKYVNEIYYYYVYRGNSILNDSTKCEKRGIDLINSSYELAARFPENKEYKSVWKNNVIHVYYDGLDAVKIAKNNVNEYINKGFIIRYGLSKKNLKKTIGLLINYKLYYKLAKIKQNHK